MRLILLFLLVLLWSANPTGGSEAGQAEEASGTVVIRCDDIGMCHTVNQALAEILKTGMPVSTSVMFACPWYQEAVDILKAAPNVAVGVHLTLNAEWKNYRWGPVAGRSAVPTLVDTEGYFFPSTDAFLAHQPSAADVEKELRAQIERGLHTGLRIDYIDYHMGTAVATTELRAIVEKLAHEYHLGISRYLGEKGLEGWYGVPPEAKPDTVLERLSEVRPDSVRLMVFHTGMETPELGALVDLNAYGLTEVSRHRAAELHVLTSAQFRASVQQHGIELITYRELIKRVGLEKMKPPQF